jgi:hypothetical protein
MEAAGRIDCGEMCRRLMPLSQTGSSQRCWLVIDQTCQHVSSTIVQQNLTFSPHPLGADCRHIEQF